MDNVFKKVRVIQAVCRLWMFLYMLMVTPWLQPWPKRLHDIPEWFLDFSTDFTCKNYLHLKRRNSLRVHNHSNVIDANCGVISWNCCDWWGQKIRDTALDHSSLPSGHQRGRSEGWGMSWMINSLSITHNAKIGETSLLENPFYSSIQRHKTAQKSYSHYLSFVIWFIESS